ncbi:MAG: hypothetical protein M5T61_20505 [Acidimicrobiia bacterium]|nr:hypothetical protein [Acidimicrobiia bacterium]
MLSFALTVVVEYGLLRVWLYRDRSPGRLAGATVVMNVVTYAVLVAAIPLLRADQRERKRDLYDQHMQERQEQVVPPPAAVPSEEPGEPTPPDPAATPALSP